MAAGQEPRVRVGHAAGKRTRLVLADRVAISVVQQAAAGVASTGGQGSRIGRRSRAARPDHTVNQPVVRVVSVTVNPAGTGNGRRADENAVPGLVLAQGAGSAATGGPRPGQADRPVQQVERGGAGMPIRIGDRNRVAIRVIPGADHQHPTRITVTGAAGRPTRHIETGMGRENRTGRAPTHTLSGPPRPTNSDHIAVAVIPRLECQAMLGTSSTDDCLVGSSSIPPSRQTQHYESRSP